MDSRGVSFTANADRDSAALYRDLDGYIEGRLASHVNRHIQRLIMDVYDRERPEAALVAHIPKVCVVGAGVAGLRCADVLSRYGFQVTIVEARDRIGGRIHQTKLASGDLVDLGPNWIHGTDGNPISTIADNTSTITHSFDEDYGIFFDEDGNILREGNELNNTMWQIIKDGFAYSAQHTSTINPSLTLHEWFKQQVDEKFPDIKDMQTKKLLMQMIEFWGAFVASEVKTQSMKFLWMEEVIDGGNLFVAETYEKILKYIAEGPLRTCKVMLETMVTRLDTSEDKVQIWTNKGYIMKFDEVVFTTPLGWLKKNHESTFIPPLPKRLCEAINNIGYGNLEKVYVNFPKAFWHGENPRPADGFVQWLAPNYAESTNPHRWNQEVVDLAVPGKCAQPTLLFYIFGDQVLALSSQLNGLGKDERSKYLIEHFKPYYSRLPHYDESLTECTPVDAIYTDWTSDPLAGNGSYTTLRNRLLEGNVDIEVMREGLPGRSLWFAGEHTAPFIAYGTVTGAYWSGMKVAQRIATAYTGGA